MASSFRERVSLVEQPLWHKGKFRKNKFTVSLPTTPFLPSLPPFLSPNFSLIENENSIIGLHRIGKFLFLKFR